MTSKAEYTTFGETRIAGSYCFTCDRPQLVLHLITEGIKTPFETWETRHAGRTEHSAAETKMKADEKEMKKDCRADRARTSRLRVKTQTRQSVQKKMCSERNKAQGAALVRGEYVKRRRDEERF